MNEKIYLSKFDNVGTSYPYFLITFPERFSKTKPKYRPILQLEVGDMVLKISPWTKEFKYFLVGEEYLFNIGTCEIENFRIKGPITIKIGQIILKSGKQLTAQQLNEMPELIIESH